MQNLREEARPFFIGVELFDDYVGEDLEREDGDVILKFRSTTTNRIFGVRFPDPVFPLEGLAYRGIWLRNVRDWVLDLRIVLVEELATRALFEAPSIARPGWEELFIAPQRWEGQPGRTIGDWSDP
jgi:hypothetical protein